MVSSINQHSDIFKGCLEIAYATNTSVQLLLVGFLHLVPQWHLKINVKNGCFVTCSAFWWVAPFTVGLKLGGGYDDSFSFLLPCPVTSSWLVFLLNILNILQSRSSSPYPLLFSCSHIPSHLAFLNSAWLAPLPSVFSHSKLLSALRVSSPKCAAPLFKTVQGFYFSFDVKAELLSMDF